MIENFGFKYAFWIVMAMTTITFISGINLPIMGIDATQYASISMEMAESGNYLEVMHRGNDYLDKPPLLFWLSSLSFNVFGIENWSYRLPSLLFVYLGIFATFRLGSLLYSKAAGYTGAIIFSTTEAISIISHDVRTDTILISSIVFAIWCIIEFLEREKFKFLILGFIGIGLAMLCKGPIGLMVPILALSTHFIIRKQWRNFFRWEWLLGICIVAIIISPMVYGLYTQYDAQPEKFTTLSSGKRVQGISGLVFYFWEQSFGRLTGESEWKDASFSYHFFIGTFIWSFLPWTILGFLALWNKIKLAIRAKEIAEYYTLGAIVLPFIALSMSQFKLDHYIYIIYPFIAIISGNYLVQLALKNQNGIIGMIQIFVIGAMGVGVVLIGTFTFTNVTVIFGFSLTALFLLLIATYLKRKSILAIVLATAISACFVNVFMKVHFYQNLAHYDGQYIAAIITNERGIPSANQHVIDISPHCYDFYTKSITHYSGTLGKLVESEIEGHSFLIKEAVFEKLDLDNLQPEVYPIQHHSTTKLNLDFLKESTRDKNTENLYLLVF